jgi:hypothetical protein
VVDGLSEGDVVVTNRQSTEIKPGVRAISKEG